MKRQITPHFNAGELECHCGCEQMLISPEGLDHLEELRRTYGRPMILGSAYRCPTHNEAVSSTGPDGPHTVVDRYNITIDVAILGASAWELVRIATRIGWTGIGIQQKGDRASRFIHLDRLWATDTRPRPWVWTY